MGSFGRFSLKVELSTEGVVCGKVGCIFREKSSGVFVYDSDINCCIADRYLELYFKLYSGDLRRVFYIIGKVYILVSILLFYRF